MVPIDWLCGSAFRNHWLWGFSDQIKSWLPGVCAYLPRKCGQSWLHSRWFSFTRAHMYRKGKFTSPLILWVNWALFFESKHFIIPEGSSEEWWKIGSTYCCCLGVNEPGTDGLWPGEQELGLGENWDIFISSALLRVPNHMEHYLMGCANSLSCSCHALNRRLVCHLISCLQCYILGVDNLSTT